ncbi:SDR family oxidoreductase [uncultured Brevundimonas sp.]|uniref:SDR family oxidoreductase n=1 Tax=uncultured Brevundimonas sp. TaxID=213418 RepID=UPI0030ED3138|tara:strand:+ start:35725 stop:37029 length:1305 start_codon:yes stop_codon:yes gene_type:complete
MTRPRVLVLGANGFIGAHVAAELARQGWRVRAGARKPDEARRRAPRHDWVKVDFGDLTTAEAWAPLLVGVSAVVNCVGVLQDGGGDSTRIAHVDGPRALIAACEAVGIRRFVHLSAVGAEDAARTAYGRSKAVTERLVAASDLDWTILRPSLVVGRAVFGGTGLIRALAAFPGVIPVIGGDQRFRPVPMEDVCAAVVASLKSEAPVCRTYDVAGTESLTLVQILELYRGWFGLPSAPVFRVPRALAWPVVALGDVVGRLGWASPLRSTALRQMDDGVEGDPEAWVHALKVTPHSLADQLSQAPATVQDVWHARLWFVRPVAIMTLGLFWLLTGVISFGPGWAAAVAILHEGGYGTAAVPVAWWGALLDVVLGLALFVRPWTARVALAMAVSTVGYLAAATISLPQYWVDPLGPWLKVLPMMALCLFVAATDRRR